MLDEPAVVLLVPLAPAATGNGLAMRAGMLLDALAPVAAVHVVIVPVSGSPDASRWAFDRAHTITVFEPVTTDTSHEHLTRQLGDAELRDRLQRTAPLPQRARLAPPTLAPAIADAVGDLSRPLTVLAMRLYLAPLGVRLAQVLAANRTVIDTDDDDASLLRSLGATDEACAFDRLARVWLPDADAVVAASRAEGAALAARAGLDRVGVVPNTAPIPARVTTPPNCGRLLFVGNLTYEPNRFAARQLVDEILPAVRQQRSDATLDLVGAHDGALDDLIGVAGVRVTGQVVDVAPYYAAADVVVVPLRHGTGTRIKVLEALAHGRAVVATATAVAGLDLDRPGAGSEDPITIAESSDDIARAVTQRLDGQTTTSLAHVAQRLAARYSPEAIAPLIRAAALGPDAGATTGTSTRPGRTP